MPEDSAKNAKVLQSRDGRQSQDNSHLAADEILASFDPFGLPNDNRSHVATAWDSKPYPAVPAAQNSDDFVRPSELFKKLELERTIPARKIVR